MVGIFVHCHEFLSLLPMIRSCDLNFFLFGGIALRFFLWAIMWWFLFRLISLGTWKKKVYDILIFSELQSSLNGLPAPVWPGPALPLISYYPLPQLLHSRHTFRGYAPNPSHCTCCFLCLEYSLLGIHMVSLSSPPNLHSAVTTMRHFFLALLNI